MLIASVAGLASNLALTVPLALVVVFGSVGATAESLFIPTRSKGVVERRPVDRERARRHREAQRQSRTLTEGKRH
jgi:hypothetical protein